MRRAVRSWRVRRALAVVWVVLVLGAVLGGVLGAVAPASAHTSLLSATPSSGSTVDALPAGVELEFSMPVQSRLAQVVVRDAGGDDHVVGPVASFDTRVAAQVRGLRAGRYTVAYRVVAADGHPVSGQYTFVVASGASASSAAAAGRPVPSVSSGGRPWLVPLLGALVVASAAALRVRHGGRRVTS